MTTTIALLGAGGKMGCRISRNMLSEPDFDMLNIEISDDGIGRLSEMGLETTPQDEALQRADAVILAIPDRLIGKLSPAVVDAVKPGCIIISLDPAAAHAEVIPLREDLSYFVTHPCHPPLFETELTEEANRDWFGGVAASQCPMCASPALKPTSSRSRARSQAPAKADTAEWMRATRSDMTQNLRPGVGHSTTRAFGMIADAPPPFSLRKLSPRSYSQWYRHAPPVPRVQATLSKAENNWRTTG